MSDLTGDYERAGFRGRLGFGRKPAVLVVDVVQAYLDPVSPLYAGVEAAVASAAALCVLLLVHWSIVPVIRMAVGIELPGVGHGDVAEEENGFHLIGIGFVGSLDDALHRCDGSGARNVAGEG